jgi:hypothetical protein
MALAAGSVAREIFLGETRQGQKHQVTYVVTRRWYRRLTEGRPEIKIVVIKAQKISWRFDKEF